MLLANFTTVRPEMGWLSGPCKIPLIAGNPSNFRLITWVISSYALI